MILQYPIGISAARPLSLGLRVCGQAPQKPVQPGGLLVFHPLPRAAALHQKQVAEMREFPRGAVRKCQRQHERLPHVFVRILRKELPQPQSVQIGNDLADLVAVRIDARPRLALRQRFELDKS